MVNRSATSGLEISIIDVQNCQRIPDIDQPSFNRRLDAT